MSERGPAAFGDQPFGVRARPLTSRGLPLLIEPAGAAPTIEELQSWIRENRVPLKQSLLQYGGLLFRGFDRVDSIAAFERIVNTVCQRLLPYVGGTTTRNHLGGKIWTASGAQYAGSIPVHQEMSYQETFPTHLMFFCDQPARRGGQTPLASARQFRAALPQGIWELFVQSGVRTDRRLSSRNSRWAVWKGRRWNDALLTEDPTEAERIMDERGWKHAWTRSGGLEIQQPPLPATRVHPETGEEVWFNQCHLNHPFVVRTATRSDRRYGLWLAAVVAQAFTRGRAYPTQTRFADGSRIPMRYPRIVQRCLDAVTVSFDWRKSDILVVDNFLTFHGRTRFEGPRVIGAALLTSAFEPDQ